MLYDTNNIEAIGAGPFRLTNITRNNSGVPEKISLESWQNFPLGKPFLKNITFRFFSNESDMVESLIDGNVGSGSGISPSNAKELATDGRLILTAPLPRIFAVFFNQKESSVLSRPEVRQELSLDIDRTQLVDKALSGFGTALSGPFLSPRPKNSTPHGNSISAEALLIGKGWEKDEDGIFQLKTKKETLRLEFELATGATDELKRAADLVASSWRRLGADVKILIFDVTDLNQKVIRPRQYEALLFGEVIGRYPDPFAFWHSSQRLDPGLNISLYGNGATDKTVSELRSTYDTVIRKKLFETFVKELTSDYPAVFLYAPDYIYAPTVGLSNVNLSGLTQPADRFLGSHKWYLFSEKVWPLFQ